MTPRRPPSIRNLRMRISRVSRRPFRDTAPAVATLIPIDLDASSPAAERLVVERLRDHLPADWTIIQGQRLATSRAGGARLREAEIDIVVLAPARMIQALARLTERRFDAVFVDEGQDFSPRMWEAVAALLADGERSHLWVCFDPEQNIYDGAFPSALNLQPYKLRINCRNTGPIARFAYGAVDAEPRLRPDAPASPEVTTVTYATEAELVAAVQRAIDALTGAGGLAPERIVVLSSKGVKKSAVWAHRTFGRFTLEQFGDGGTANTIRFSTLQGFKGLEADAVVLCEIGPSTAPRWVYVAASRAKHVLWCVREAGAS